MRLGPSSPRSRAFLGPPPSDHNIEGGGLETARLLTTYRDYIGSLFNPPTGRFSALLSKVVERSSCYGQHFPAFQHQYWPASLVCGSHDEDQVVRFPGTASTVPRSIRDQDSSIVATLVTSGS